MKIAPINNLSYNYKLSLKGAIANKTSLPFLVEHPKFDSCQSLECRYEYTNNVLKELNKRKDELYTYLDSASDDAGLTVPDKLASMFDINSSKMMEASFMHKTMQNNVESLQNNGFDPEKIAKTEFGPGFYVGSNEGGLQIYSGAKLGVKYRGNTVQGRNLSKFNAINSQIINLLRNYLNLKTDFNNKFLMDEIEAFRKFANEYSRKIITDKLGIDGAYANESDGYFVIFNPDAIKEIKQI